MENVVLVNKDNQRIGLENKIIAHKKGLLHRAFSIIVYNNKRELLIQRRASNKYHTPNLWTNTCCSHPYENENYDEAIHRRLEEEMGMQCRLTKDFSFLYKAKLNNNLIEYEHDTVFLGQTDTLPLINKEEVSEYRYISYSDLDKEIKYFDSKFTPWFKIILKKIDSDFFNFKNFYYA